MKKVNSVKKSIVLATGLALIVGMSACSTTSGVSQTSSAAPISYKVGQGATTYASVRTPTSYSYAAPQYVAPQVAQQMVQQAPRTVQPKSYAPLRQQPQAAPREVAQSITAPTPQIAKQAQAKPAPIAPRVAKPVYTPETSSDEGLTTLTIKGPVHMASSNSKDTAPRFIPAVNYRTYKTNK